MSNFVSRVLHVIQIIRENILLRSTAALLRLVLFAPKPLASRGGKRAQKTPNTTKSWGAEQKNPQEPEKEKTKKKKKTRTQTDYMTVND